MAQNGFGKLVAHAPYTMNACSKDERVREFARMCMKEDRRRWNFSREITITFIPAAMWGRAQRMEFG